jgi:DNA repair exonuclease SbcCD nuclease subunit
MAKKKDEWSSETSLATLLARPAKGPRFGYITDPHARNRGPKNRSDDWRQTLLDKLEWVCGALEQLGAEKVLICGGDLFDQPAVNFEVADDIVDLFQRLNWKLRSVFGNHDLSGALATAPRTILGHLMRRSPETISPLPFLTSSYPLELGEGKLQLWGHHYKYQSYLRDDAGELIFDEVHGPERLEVPIVDRDAKRIIVSHAMILREKPVFDAYQLFEEVETNAHLVLLGHYHPMQAMMRLQNTYQTWIGGPGAMMRGALSRDDLSRKPSMAVVEYDLENDDLLIDYVPIEVAKPAEDVFLLAEAQAEQRKNAALEAFVADLDNLSVQKLSVAGIIEEISAAESLPDDVRDEALRRIGVQT